MKTFTATYRLLIQTDGRKIRRRYTPIINRPIEAEDRSDAKSKVEALVDAHVQNSRTCHGRTAIIISEGNK